MEAENSEPMSPRERFLDEQRKIGEAKAAAKDPALTVTDAEVDEVESDMEEIDKTMGTERYTVTRQEYETVKVERAKQDAVDNMQVFGKNTQLTNEQRGALQKILQQRRTITDPVLKHLITQKAMHEVGYLELKKKVKDINERVMSELMKASSDLVKTQGIMENLDDQILKYVEQNPGSV